MNRYIDLTLPVSTEIPVFPGDPVAIIKPFLTHEKDGCSVTQFNFPSHWATHIDAPYHMLPKGKKLDQFGLEKFIGQGIVIDARASFAKASAGQSKKMIDSDIVKDIVISKDSIVLICTNYSQQLAGPVPGFRPASAPFTSLPSALPGALPPVPPAHFEDYFKNSPYLTEDFAQMMVEKGVKIVGVDFPNPDSFDSHDFPVHKILLGQDILIVENLVNLQPLLGKRFAVYALPMKVNEDGGPVRIIAQLNSI